MKAAARRGLAEMTASRCRAAGQGPALAAAAPIHEALNERVRYRDRGRHFKPFGVTMGKHARCLIAAEPARVRDFSRINGKLLAQRRGPAANHQRMREWPGLTCDVANPPSIDAGLLLD